MNDVPLCVREEKRENEQADSTDSKIAEKSETDGTAAPRAARQDQFPAGEARGEMRSREGAPNSNLAAKRAMAADLIGMGFSASQACRILHLSRHELGKRGNAGAAERLQRRSK